MSNVCHLWISGNDSNISGNTLYTFIYKTFQITLKKLQVNNQTLNKLVASELNEKWRNEYKDTHRLENNKEKKNTHGYSGELNSRCECVFYTFIRKKLFF